MAVSIGALEWGPLDVFASVDRTSCVTTMRLSLAEWLAALGGTVFAVVITGWPIGGWAVTALAIAIGGCAAVAIALGGSMGPAWTSWP